MINILDTRDKEELLELIGSSGGGSSITVDDALSTTSVNPVQNKVITNTLSDYATKEDLENFDNAIELTKAEYDALPDDKLINNTTYFVKDMEIPSGSGGDITIDSALSETSTNPVQNKVITEALNNKADTSHGTHVTYSNTVPVMDGGASLGSATTVARSDHKHPSDTSRVATSNVLSTVAECSASTNNKDVASASALTELNDSLKIIMKYYTTETVSIEYNQFAIFSIPVEEGYILLDARIYSTSVSNHAHQFIGVPVGQNQFRVHNTYNGTLTDSFYIRAFFAKVREKS